MTLPNYANAKFDKTEIPMTSYKFKTERKYFIIKKNRILKINKYTNKIKKYKKHFKILSLFSKLILLILDFLFLYVELLGFVVVAY